MNDDENEIENDDDLNKQVVFCANDKNIAEFECSDCNYSLSRRKVHTRIKFLNKNHSITPF